jgi:hypothetical protein
MEERELEEPDFRPIPIDAFLRFPEASLRNSMRDGAASSNVGVSRPWASGVARIARGHGRNLLTRKRHAMLKPLITRASVGDVQTSRLKSRH